MISPVELYDRLPAGFQSVIKPIYQKIRYGKSDKKIKKEIINNLFENSKEYEIYSNEYQNEKAKRIRQQSLENYNELTGRDELYGIDPMAGSNLYALVRALKPDKIIETGVCNGVSTLVVLLALEQNGSGKLYSIDYPIRTDEPLEKIRSETYDEHGGAAIPADKDPGWIIPDDLRNRWELTVGKSQRTLPTLLSNLDTEIDLFIHDSEHSYSCMLMELELAREWLSSDGVIIADDIDWNGAFERFVNERNLVSGNLSRNSGFAFNK